MANSITFRGVAGSLLWGYRTAATLTAWRIAMEKNAWKLTATVDRCDAFQARQRPLLFTAPRDKGRWCWEVQEIHISDKQLTATLGPPLQ